MKTSTIIEKFKNGIRVAKLGAVAAVFAGCATEEEIDWNRGGTKEDAKNSIIVDNNGHNADLNNIASDELTTLSIDELIDASCFRIASVENHYLKGKSMFRSMDCAEYYNSRGCTEYGKRLMIEKDNRAIDCEVKYYENEIDINGWEQCSHENTLQNYTLRIWDECEGSEINM